ISAISLSAFWASKSITINIRPRVSRVSTGTGEVVIGIGEVKGELTDFLGDIATASELARNLDKADELINAISNTQNNGKVMEADIATALSSAAALASAETVAGITGEAVIDGPGKAQQLWDDASKMAKRATTMGTALGTAKAIAAKLDGADAVVAALDSAQAEFDAIVLAMQRVKDALDQVAATYGLNDDDGSGTVKQDPDADVDADNPDAEATGEVSAGDSKNADADAGAEVTGEVSAGDSKNADGQNPEDEEKSK
ncbi:MAG: hypothetical protein AAF570_17050, partial [Bacteroidota bacterium]